MVYRITAVTPDQGKVTYDVLDEREARKHSNLLERQLMGDGTQGVTVRVV